MIPSAKSPGIILTGGEARFRNGTVTVAGDLVLDLATGGILRLRLTQPLAV